MWLTYKGSVLLSCVNKLALGLMSTTDKLVKKTPNSGNFIISQTDRSGMFAINKKTSGSSYDQSINKQPQPNTDNKPIVHTKEDLMSLYLDCSTGLSKFQGEPYHVEVQLIVLPK